MKGMLLMGRKELLALRPHDVSELTADEVVHIARMLGAFWSYDYEAASEGRVGMHAILKSGLHSDGFFVSRILLEPENIREIMARQIERRLVNEGVPAPEYVAGIPDGATALGTSVANRLLAREAQMRKTNGRIVLETKIPDGATLLLVEDFCTRGTGFTEAVYEVRSKQPGVRILPFDPVIINRGGLRAVPVEGVGDFTVVPVVERRILDWNPIDHCTLCELGSKPIKPKATDENWRLLTTSQFNENRVRS